MMTQQKSATEGLEVRHANAVEILSTRFTGEITVYLQKCKWIHKNVRKYNGRTHSYPIYCGYDEAAVPRGMIEPGQKI